MACTPEFDSATSKIISSAISECLRKLKLSQASSPNVSIFSGDLAATLGGETKKIYDKECGLQNSLNEVLIKRERVKHLKNKTQLRNTQIKISHFEQNLKDTKKILTRNLWDNERIVQNVAKIEKGIQEIIAALSETANEMEKFGSFETLCRYLKSISAMSTSHENCKKEEVQVIKKLQELQEDLSNKTSTHTAEIAKLNDSFLL